MKNNYFFMVLFTLTLGTANAQFTDDMESYTPGADIYQDWWTDWGCGGTCALQASSDQALSGSVSGFVDDGGAMDAVLDLGNKTSGVWYLQFYMYVPTGQEGYWNIQGTVPIGSGEWVMGDFHFNQDLADPGVGLITDSPGAPVNFNFPHDQWFEVYLKVDISSGIASATCHLQIDGTDVLVDGTAFTDSAGAAPTSLGGIDFFSISTDNTYYLDDFSFSNTDPHLSVDVFKDKGFSFFPNPVTNVLNLKANESINSVTVYDVLGKEVYHAKVEAVASQIDMSQLGHGTYFVMVNIGEVEGVVRVVK